MSRARASTTTGSSFRCRRGGDERAAEGGRGRQRAARCNGVRPRRDSTCRPLPSVAAPCRPVSRCPPRHHHVHPRRDRKSTRLNSSHGYISYAVFCLKKKRRTCLRERVYLECTDCKHRVQNLALDPSVAVRAQTTTRARYPQRDLHLLHVLLSYMAKH